MSATTTAEAIFIVGSSRSGTTLMGRILGRHPSVFTFTELHFFEQLWSGTTSSQPLDDEEAVGLFARLLAIQRDGYLHQGDPGRFRSEAERAWANAADSVSQEALSVFSVFLAYETRLQGATIPCQQTPRDVFYLPEIREAFPEARVLHMVRDPRAVVLSQKNKWRRGMLTGSEVYPRREMVRAWLKYHPALVSRLWTASVDAADRFGGEIWLREVRFEDLLSAPDEKVAEACRFLGIGFDPEMLLVPQVGSSNAPDRPERRGLDPTRAQRWREALGPGEIRICQGIAGDRLARHGYEPVAVRGGYAELLFQTAILPIKAFLFFLVNLTRVRNLPAALRRRLS